jgi:hypothetical protein
MLEVEAVPQSCIPKVQIGLSIVLYMRSLLLVESFDFRPSNQYILVRVILSYLSSGFLKIVYEIQLYKLVVLMTIAV